MGFSRLFKWFSSWRKRKFASVPVNVIEPFVFPAPDDPRWVAKTNRRLIFYELDVVRCYMYSSGGGFIVIDGTLLTDLPLNKTSEFYRHKERKYAIAVAKSYMLTHSEWNPTLELSHERIKIESEIVAQLSHINFNCLQSIGQK
jgi:hypothetical protein